MDLSAWKILKEVCVCVFSHIQLFVIQWAGACQAPLSMGFSRQEYWSGLPFPPPGDLPSPGIKSKSLESPALSGRFFTPEPLGKPKRSLAISKMVFSKHSVHGDTEELV